jgi:hypothetical protein
MRDGGLSRPGMVQTTAPARNWKKRPQVSVGGRSEHTTSTQNIEVNGRANALRSTAPSSPGPSPRVVDLSEGPEPPRSPNILAA